MTTAPAPVREPAWSLSRSRDRAVGHRGRHQRRCHPRRSARRLFLHLRAGGRSAARCRCCAGLVPIAVVLYAVVAIGVRPWLALPGAPLGGHRRRGLHAHRLADPHLDAGARSPASRPSTSPAASCSSCSGCPRSRCCTASSQGTVRIWHLEADVAQRVADDLAAPGGAGPRPGHVTGPARRRGGRRRASSWCTPSRSARRGSSSRASSRLVAAIGLGGGTTDRRRARRRRHPAVPGHGGARPGGGSATLDGPTSVVVTRGLLSRSVRTVPNDRIRGVEVETPPLHRLFGLVRVRIDAAAGAVGAARTRNCSSTASPAPRATGCGPPS